MNMHRGNLVHASEPRELLTQLWRDEKGVTMTETALIIVLIALAVVFALPPVGEVFLSVYQTVAEAFPE